MSHLSIERLAALADEPATPAEAAHLASCEACARERVAHERLRAMARAEQMAIGAPLTTWEGIAAKLEPSRPSRWARYAAGMAAGLVLATGGVALGRYSAGASVMPGRGNAPVLADAGPAASGSAASTAPTAAADSMAFTNIDDARAARARYEALYQNAAAYIAHHDSASVAPESPAAMRTRLAALDRVNRAMRDAMHRAPYDPVINGYYLTTIGQREQTIRQLNTVLPVGLRINSY